MDIQSLIGKTIKSIEEFHDGGIINILFECGTMLFIEERTMYGFRYNISINNVNKENEAPKQTVNELQVYEQILKEAEHTSIYKMVTERRENDSGKRHSLSEVMKEANNKGGIDYE